MSVEVISKYLDQYQNKFYSYSHKEHIERWLSQFKEQDIIASELAHIMDSVFVEEKNEVIFFEGLLNNPKLIESIGLPSNYSILDIQAKGKSQSIYSKKLKKVFKDGLGEDIPINDFSKDVLIYVDDFMFSGMKARHDILNLFKDKERRRIVYIFIGIHSNAAFYLDKSLKEKKIVQSVWSCISFNNMKSSKDVSDVFWPKESIKTNPKVHEFLRLTNRENSIFRSDSATSSGSLEIFTSNVNREIIENEFLLAGIKIIQECHTEFPPLGISAFKGIGFGGTAMSYRNIPNNTPLCLWWGNPNKQAGLGAWYPLMMRKVYD